MGKIILTFAILFSVTSFAHESEELSESEVVLQMFERDLNQELSQATLLYNSVLASTVPTEKKCGYIDELKKTLSKCDIGLKQYMGTINGHQPNYFEQFDQDPNQVSIRQIRAYQMESRLNNFFSVVPTLSKNHNCN